MCAFISDWLFFSTLPAPHNLNFIPHKFMVLGVSVAHPAPKELKTCWALQLTASYVMLTANGLCGLILYVNLVM